MNVSVARALNVSVQITRAIDHEKRLMHEAMDCLGHYPVGCYWLDRNRIGAEKIRVSGGGITPLHSLIWVAHQEGLFKKYGMEVEYLVMNSGTLGVQTLLSNDSQFLFSTGALAITANLQGADIAMITGGFNLFAFKVVGRPEIKSVQDLARQEGFHQPIRFGHRFRGAGEFGKIRRRPQTGDCDSAGQQFQPAYGSDQRFHRSLAVHRAFRDHGDQETSNGIALGHGRSRHGLPAKLLDDQAQLSRSQQGKGDQLRQGVVEALFIAQRDRDADHPDDKKIHSRRRRSVRHRLRLFS